ncbi:MAG: TlpA family protein disulfide reductase [Acidimicrobiia bacterium]|nr:TlpA family protein disulfide reductase [Acidimicrobiia bacterium]
MFEGMLVGARGRPVVVNLWASWCAPCRAEMPLLQRAADGLAERAVILGVASEADQRDAQAFLDELGVTYANVFDATGEIRSRLELTGYPTTYVFDGTGRLRTKFTGAISEQQIVAFIEDAEVQ